MNIPEIGPIRGLEELQGSTGTGKSRTDGTRFANSLKQAIHKVDNLQKETEATEAAYARGENVDLHEVLIKVEEAEIAFKTMMEVKNKLVEAYQEMMRMA